MNALPGRIYPLGPLPCCGGTEYYEGPAGGRSVNAKCAGCGHRWNLLGPIGVEDIDPNPLPEDVVR